MGLWDVESSRGFLGDFGRSSWVSRPAETGVWPLYRVRLSIPQIIIYSDAVGETSELPLC